MATLREPIYKNKKQTFSQLSGIRLALALALRLSLGAALLSEASEMPLKVRFQYLNEKIRSTSIHKEKNLYLLNCNKKNNLNVKQTDGWCLQYVVSY